jgi:hypothetical protein
VREGHANQVTPETVKPVWRRKRARGGKVRGLSRILRKQIMGYWPGFIVGIYPTQFAYQPKTAISRLRNHLLTSYVILHNFEVARQNEFFELGIAVVPPHAIYLVVLSRPDVIAAAPTPTTISWFRLPPASPNRYDGWDMKVSHLDYAWGRRGPA